jgi:hypothetical protein
MEPTSGTNQGTAGVNQQCKGTTRLIVPTKCTACGAGSRQGRALPSYVALLPSPSGTAPAPSPSPAAQLSAACAGWQGRPCKAVSHKSKGASKRATNQPERSAPDEQKGKQCCFKEQGARSNHAQAQRSTRLLAVCSEQGCLPHTYGSLLAAGRCRLATHRSTAISAHAAAAC